MRIAVIAGDGIGPEVVGASLSVLRCMASHYGWSLAISELDYGATRMLRDGVMLPAEAPAQLAENYDAILLGALGDPRVPDMRHGRSILLGLRRELDLFVNLRPSRCLLDDFCPLRAVSANAVDFIIVRENTEGAYFGATHWRNQGTPAERAIHESHHSRQNIERTLRYAFALAATRSAPRLTLADKSNAIEAHRLWRRVFDELGETWRDAVETEALYIDALAHELVRDPARFSVIVTTNLFGDILSDLGAALQGGLGLAPSANVHPGRTSLFEPVHGSAPSLAGRGVANPVGTLLSVAMMLDALEHSKAAEHLRHAIRETLDEGVRTPDVGGCATTEQVVERVMEIISRAPNVREGS